MNPSPEEAREYRAHMLEHDEFMIGWLARHGVVLCARNHKHEWCEIENPMDLLKCMYKKVEE